MRNGNLLKSVVSEICLKQICVNQRVGVASFNLMRGTLKVDWQHIMICLKVSNSQKQILKFSFEPKIEQKYFCISAIASKKRSNQKRSVRESK